MPESFEKARRELEDLLGDRSSASLLAELRPDKEAPAQTIPAFMSNREEAVRQRLEMLQLDDSSREILLDPQTVAHLETCQANIEGLIGTVKVPLGIAGPLRVKGLFANGDYLLPLATHEAALVASCHRGAAAITESGGCRSILLNEGVARAPGFSFRDFPEAGLFLQWALSQFDTFRTVAEATTRHGKLRDIRVTVEGCNVYLIFEYTTGDAAGQNMVTVATDAVCRHIIEYTPVKPRHWFVESNMSGDKKASVQSFLTVRGKKVTAEVLLPAEVIHKRLRSTAREMEHFWRMSAMGGVMSGTIGVQGHFANPLAALYIACGQDAACVAESAIGVTRFEAMDDGSLYAAVTLPNLIVGTVGGGTFLPSQQACLKILGLAGGGKSRAFAGVCGAAALAGELSIIAALASGDFTRAHELLARRRKKKAAPSATS
jgi:hydroxymethylglutaryl-CoA reductase (NADPH)